MSFRGIRTCPFQLFHPAWKTDRFGVLADSIRGCIRFSLRCFPPSAQAFETGPRHNSNSLPFAISCWCSSANRRPGPGWPASTGSSGSGSMVCGRAAWTSSPSSRRTPSFAGTEGAFDCSGQGGPGRDDGDARRHGPGGPSSPAMRTDSPRSIRWSSRPHPFACSMPSSCRAMNGAGWFTSTDHAELWRLNRDASGASRGQALDLDQPMDMIIPPCFARDRWFSRIRRASRRAAAGCFIASARQ